MEVLLGTVFISSLLGSLHCVGMCGPFALLAGSHAGTRRSAILPTVAYSGGRLLSYALCGAIFGALGMAINSSSTFFSLQQLATYLAGGLMIVVGMIAFARCIGWQIRLPNIFHPVQKFLQALYARTKQMAPLRRAATIGALSSLMPCGWLYTFAIAAAGTGSPFWGTILMIVFWAGTVPIMAALMLGFGQLGSSIQKQIPVTMAVVVIVLGIYTVAFRAPVALANEPINVVDNRDDIVQQIINTDQDLLPCCRGEDEQ